MRYSVHTYRFPPGAVELRAVDGTPITGVENGTAHAVISNEKAAFESTAWEWFTDLEAAEQQVRVLNAREVLKEAEQPQ